MLDAAMPKSDFSAANTPPPRRASLLVAEGLCFEANGHRLIASLDLQLDQGSRSVIMGPNGAGKSLLLRLIHGLLKPSAGSVAWAGCDVGRATKHRQAMVFQRPVLLRRSAAANVRYAMAVHAVPRHEREARLQFVLQAAGLEHLAAKPARVLSGGEQQRLAIARALSIRPQVLFLDEPTASLDPASTLAVENLIQHAHAAGTKIVLVTHDIGQAKRIADDVVFMYRGQVEEHSSADKFFGNARSARAQAYLDGRIVL